MVNLDKLLESQGLYRTAYHTGQSFVWRMLTLKEYRVFKALTNSGAMTITEAYLKVFERCYVGNHLLINENIPVGMLVSIGELIMYISGDCSNETLKNDIATVRNMYPVNNAEEYMKRIIFTAFSGYVVEDLDGWTRPELLRKFIISESILQMRGNYEPLNTDDIFNSNEEVERVKKKKPKFNTSRIDFDRDNDALRKTQSPMDAEDEMEELQARKSNKKSSALDPSQLRKLDKRGDSRGS
jgi:hypothetical protein